MQMLKYLAKFFFYKYLPDLWHNAGIVEFIFTYIIGKPDNRVERI